MNKVILERIKRMGRQMLEDDIYPRSASIDIRPVVYHEKLGKSIATPQCFLSDVHRDGRKISFKIRERYYEYFESKLFEIKDDLTREEVHPY